MLFLQMKRFCDLMAQMLDCGLEVSEFELESRYYLRFWINMLGKEMNSLLFLKLRVK